MIEPRLRRLAGILVLALSAAAPLAAFAQDEGAQDAGERSPLAVEAVRVTAAGDDPDRPITADTLCRLRVAIRNDGDRPASHLDFVVTVNGRELAIYDKHTFHYPLPPGEVTEVPLYNFWTTESGRPAPGDGKYRVEVALTRARWHEAGDEVTVLGEVPGLPRKASTVVGES